MFVGGDLARTEVPLASGASSSCSSSWQRLASRLRSGRPNRTYRVHSPSLFEIPLPPAIIMLVSLGEGELYNRNCCFRQPAPIGPIRMICGGCRVLGVKIV